MICAHKESTAWLRGQAGFTLMEALIALVVLSVGMLGIAALYVEGLKSSRTAIYRSTAVSLASDMVDRIRANPGAEYEYEKAGSDFGCVNGGVTCTAAQLAQHDVLVWSNEVGSRMPSGTEVDIDVSDIDPYTRYEVSIEWPEPGYETALSYSLTVEM